MAKICPICGEKIKCKVNVADGVICAVCSTLSDNHKIENVETVRKYWDENQKRVSIFVQTSVIKEFMSSCVVIDNVNKMFYLGVENFIYKTCYYFSEVLEYNLEQVGGKIVTKSKGGIGRAVVGGVLFGGVGAIVGATTSKTETKTVGGVKVVKITLDTYTGKRVITLQNPPSGIVSFLDKCIDEVQELPQPISSTADEIQKFKSLLDQGIVTQEEFEAKKKQLLGL